jgi:hypothetical protein
MSLSLSPEKKGYSSKGTAQPLERIGLWPENPVKRISSKTLTLPFLQKYTYVFIYCTNLLKVLPCCSSLIQFRIRRRGWLIQLVELDQLAILERR